MATPPSPADQPTPDQPTDQPTPDQLADQPADHDAAGLAMLRRLAELGMQLACATQANALAQVQAATNGGQPAPASSTAGFEAVARCVRRTVLTIHHLAHPKPQRASPAASQHADAPASRAAVRSRVLRAVQDAIEQRAEDDGHAEHLVREAIERLDRPELVEQLQDRPAAELIEEIVRDLGVAASLPGVPPGMRRTPRDVAALAAWAAAPPGTPACELPLLRPPQPSARSIPAEHPDDLVEMRLLSDAQIKAGCEREEARKRAHARAREGGSG